MIEAEPGSPARSLHQCLQQSGDVDKCVAHQQEPVHIHTHDNLQFTNFVNLATLSSQTTTRDRQACVGWGDGKSCQKSVQAHYAHGDDGSDEVDVAEENGTLRDAHGEDESATRLSVAARHGEYTQEGDDLVTGHGVQQARRTFAGDAKCKGVDVKHTYSTGWSSKGNILSSGQYTSSAKTL